MRGLSRSAAPSFELSISRFNNGRVEGQSGRGRDWELSGFDSKFIGVAKRGFPQPDRSAPECGRQTMSAYRRQPSCSGNGSWSSVNQNRQTA
ncbi:hypothetical protein SLA2020_164960 [Shorea laevis]